VRFITRIDLGGPVGMSICGVVDEGLGCSVGSAALLAVGDNRRQSAVNAWVWVQKFPHEIVDPPATLGVP